MTDSDALKLLFAQELLCLADVFVFLGTKEGSTLVV